MFSQLAANLLFCQNPSSNQQLSQPSLDRHFEHAKLLSKLRSLLWQNSESLSTTQFTFRSVLFGVKVMFQKRFISSTVTYYFFDCCRYTEVKSVLAASHHFINSLEKSCCLVSLLPLTWKERATLITEHLQDKLGDKASVLSGFCSLLLEFITVLNIIEQQCVGSEVVETETLAQVCTLLSTKYEYYLLDLFMNNGKYILFACRSAWRGLCWDVWNLNYFPLFL